jgi:hypothetical protein
VTVAGVTVIAPPAAVAPADQVPPQATITPLIVVATIDPGIGGTLTAASGALSVLVAAGAYADTLTVSLGPAPNSTGIGNLIVGDTAYVLSLVDSTGASVTTFDQPWC